MLNLTLFFMQQGQQQGGGAMGVLLPMLLIFAIMYFLIFRPQMKKQKQHQAMVASLKKGDKIVTAGGIHGTIEGVKEKEGVLIVKVADNVKIRLSRASVAKVVRDDNGRA